MGFGSPVHWLIVLVIVILIFGTKKLRNLGSDLGGAVKGFKDGMKDGNTTAAEKTADAAAPAAAVSTDKTTIDVEVKNKS